MGDAGGWPIATLGSMLQEIRRALRRLRNDPLYSLTVLGVLGLTTGAAVALFTVVDRTLLQPLPYAEPERVTLVLRQSLRDGARGPFSPADFLDMRERVRSFEQMAACESWSPVLTGAGQAERLTGLRATGELFAMLGVPPLLGRTPGVADDEPGAGPVVLISYGLWQRLFAADPPIPSTTFRVGAGRRREFGKTFGTVIEQPEFLTTSRSKLAIGPPLLHYFIALARRAQRTVKVRVFD